MTMAVGRRPACYWLEERLHTAQRARSFVRQDTEPNARGEPAPIVAGPGPLGRSRSAAAGQYVLTGAQAPGAGPLRRLELAAADLGAAALAALEATGLGMLGGFATRHKNSLATSIREIEFFAIDFATRRCFVEDPPSSLCRSPKTCRPFSLVRSCSAVRAFRPFR